MEKENLNAGFQIAGRIPILLALKRVEELKPHEEIVATDLQGILKALEHDPLLRHPIIADSGSGAVLDGTHRLAALIELGCRTVPTAVIDYQNPLVRVDRWFRGIKGENLRKFSKRVARMNPENASMIEADRRLLSRESFACLRDRKDCMVFNSKDPDPLKLYRKAFELEQIVRDQGLKIDYNDNEDTTNLSEAGFLMSTIRLEKSEVVSSCINHVLFPPKSTRHLIPSRPLGVNVPLSWLKSATNEAEAKFERHLSSKTVRRLQKGSRVGSRRYMEEVFLFE